jgi:hypothetical protein
MSKNKFAVWKNVKSAFSGMGSTAQDIEWRPVVAFLLILGMTEVMGAVSSEIRGDDSAMAIFSSNALFQETLFILVWFIALAPYGVSIHRQVLLSEKPTGGYFRAIIEMRSLKFAIAGFVFFFITIHVPSILFSAGVIFRGLLGYFILLGFVWMFIAGVIFARVCIYLPAIAVDSQNQNLSAAWNITRGSTWRIWFGLLTISIPFTVLDKILGKISPSLSENFVMLSLYDGFAAFILCVQFLVSVRFVSLVYEERTRNQRCGNGRQPP